MSVDCRRIIIGAPNNDGKGLSDSGNARVYEEVKGTWKQVGDDIDGEGNSDESGYNVYMSSDGKRVVIGAIYNDGNGCNSDHVRVYEEVNGTWKQVGNDIDGEAEGDRSGSSASMSGDGKIVAIGAK